MASEKMEKILEDIGSLTLLEVAELADQVTVLHEGRTILAGTPREVFAQRDSLRTCGLGCPAAADIVQALYETGLVVRQDAVTTSEAVETIWQAMMP